MIDRDVSDALTQHVWDELAAEFGSFIAGTGRFERAYNEDAGFGEDDGDAPMLVKRLSDGALFAVQLRALAVQVPDTAAREKTAAELPGDCCWVLVRPCGCPVGVTTARQGDLIHAVAEAEALMSLYSDDWGRAELDLQAGYRIALVAWDKYREDYAPQFGKCPHEGQPVLPGMKSSR